MTRRLTVAAAQLGPIQKTEGREVAVQRMVRLMEWAHKRGAEVVVFPELALTTFFPRWYHEDIAEADHWFETAMPNPAVAPLFAAARKYGIAFYLGYAEERRRKAGASTPPPSSPPPARWCSSTARSTCRELPATTTPCARCSTSGEALFRGGGPRVSGGPGRRSGSAGPVNLGMMICNDRRWPESWRVLRLCNR